MWRRTRALVRRVVVGCLALALLCAGYLWLSTPLPTSQHLRERAALGSTQILDRRGQLLATITDPLGGYQRPVTLSSVPLALRQATIAVEDAAFYQHPGVDLRGVVRALWINLRQGELRAGGSTITQQLARSFLLDPALGQQRSLERKLREVVLALKLSATYSKDEILELYLNQVYYGGRAYGVEAAARQLFGKPVRDLDLAECALLAGLPQAPSRYYPLNGPDALTAARTRQADVLDAMVRAGFLDGQAAEAAKAEALQFDASPEPMRAPHFVTYVLAQLVLAYGEEAVARGGLTVTTTLDADLNDSAEDALREQIAALTVPDQGPDHNVRNGAVVVLDPGDGAILAMVGSPDFADAHVQGQVNGALALRQPGSAIKPLTYAAALERGWTPATTILDVPSTFTTREGEPYTPQNYDLSFQGPLALREALATSSNIAAVRVLDQIGIPALLDMARRLGVASLGDAPGRYGLALTLGGGEVSLLELSGAYAAFANGGSRVQPYGILAVSGPDGAAMPTQPERVAPAQVLAPEVAYLISDILSDRYARMRVFGEASVLDVDRPAAAKTGTTSDWRDNWTLGYSPDRVVGVWVGNADGEPMRAVSGISGAGPIWHAVMLAAHRGLPPRAFARPPGIVEHEVCAEGGMLPAPSCPATHLERFVAGTAPTQPDTTHRAVWVDPRRGCELAEGEPGATLRLVRLLPPEAEPWAIAAGLPRVPRARCDGAAGLASRNGSANESPQLLSPAPGALYALSAELAPAQQRVELRGLAGSEIARWRLLVDGQVVAALDGPPIRALWSPLAGAHQAQLEVEDAQGRVRRSTVVEFWVER